MPEVLDFYCFPVQNDKKSAAANPILYVPWKKMEGNLDSFSVFHERWAISGGSLSFSWKKGILLFI